MDINLVAVVISLIFSAFFSAVEIAFVSSSRLYVALQKKKETLTGTILSKFYENRSHFISTCLVGNTVALVIYGIFSAAMLEPPIEAYLEKFHLLESTVDVLTLLIQTIISTIIVLATAEFIPKSISLSNPEGFLAVSSFPMNIIYTLCFPLVWVVEKLSNVFITKVLKVKYSEEHPPFKLSDLSDYIERHMLQKDDQNEQMDVDTKILSNALEFKSIQVRECMIPRKEVIACEKKETIEELKQAFMESGHSKIPIYEDSIDNIIGYCHVFHMYNKPEKITDIITEIITVPEAMLANELMIKFNTQKKSMALVIDEFGGTSGIVTVEDVMEEIIGEIEDEHDEEELLFQKIDDSNFLLSARHEIDYLNENNDWNLPDGDYETLGGYILSIYHDIPSIGQAIETDRFKFVVKSMEEVRIDEIHLTLKGNEEKQGQ
ncbi:hemolysin family protein [Sediminitomix flava]|uniref:CBS domain containing-hemolysin-like protein n=1 Tax=Sediminitomix flava TaxID=379075 RepID=A0A315Z7Q7_SEDFL|nr:hemolysin family protein [Sediminitomix flava]PWJ40776.1 CBS domain containing-hemolysin-like protein [Sediminitomix flava]